MTRLVFSIVFLVILAVFIAFNAQYTTDINLFGYKLTAVPTVAVVLLTLVTGVIYSFGLYLITYFSKRRAEKAKALKRENTQKAKELKNQEEELKSAKQSLPETDDSGAQVLDQSAAKSGKKKGRSALSKLFGGKKSKS